MSPCVEKIYRDKIMKKVMTNKIIYFILVTVALKLRENKVKIFIVDLRIIRIINFRKLLIKK